MQNVVGTFLHDMPKVQVTFNPDSTFEYISNQQHPTFYRWENFSEKGYWALSGDTIILNPNLSKKPFVESDFKEQQNPVDTNFLLTFNHIKRHYNATGSIVQVDTFQIERVDYAFNETKKKRLTRVAPHLTTRCMFAGYIPKEIITTNRTLSIKKPEKNIKSIFIGCYELQGTKEFGIKNPNSNHLTLNVYSNYYEDGQIRQMKLLIKNGKILYTRQKENGQFEKDNFCTNTDARLTRKKGGN